MPTLPHVEDILESFAPAPGSDLPETVQKAIFLARELQERAAELQSPQERRQQAELDRMMQHPGDKVTLTQLTDQGFRAGDPNRAVDQLIHILDVQGIPRFFSGVDRTLLKGFQSFGSYLPGVAVPLVKEKMRDETANVILPAERELLLPHLEARRRAGLRMNVNYLGEALLGEHDAGRRLQMYLQALQLPEIEVISVKISTIYSQISSLAREPTIKKLCERLELLYRAAQKARYTRQDNTVVPKFVYLDMEEYRDMWITAEAFMRTLERPGLEHAAAGIALQAYIPDSFQVQQRINAWARERVAAGGSPVTIRLVKGANMEMECVEASLSGWEQAPFRTKLECDANYKRMLHTALEPDNLRAVSLGVASHNLFDVAYGLVCALDAGALDRVQFEMLEGMANHQRRALFELTDNLLLYAAATPKDGFVHAIGYLIRRLDENTGPQNFLRHAFRLRAGGPEWRELEQSFLASFAAIEDLPDTPRRVQDRSRPVDVTRLTPAGRSWQEFANEPDTDFSSIANVRWAEGIVERWRSLAAGPPCEIPIVAAGEEIFTDRPVRECHDPSRPGEVVGRYRQATAEDVDRATRAARADVDGWRALTPEVRVATLRRVAAELRAARGDLMGAALADGGKTLLESDPEVSEAVDFVEFYADTARYFQSLPGIRARGKGVVAVVPPWNFPIAIPCGGVTSALAAGNNVILKPASDTVLVAYTLCQAFWRAGVSRHTLQFLPCSGRDAGSRLVQSPEVDAVILTGGTETARAMLRAKPDMNLLAETGGKNATIVTALADREQAIKNVVHSAFSHSGQKCSATSLLLLEAEVYDDPAFKETLCDAVESVPVGSAWDVESKVGPMIHAPSGKLEGALKELEPGESWAVLPHQREGNPNLYSPAVKWGVRRGSVTHLTEFFGPVLGVMRVGSLREAIDIVNETGYGLTSGLESLDDREQELWAENVEAGNLYINRGTTGAIVLRQPFGGFKKSAFGPGIKAGGPNYVAQLMEFEATKSPNVKMAKTDKTDKTDGAQGGRCADPLLDDLRRQLLDLAKAPPANAREEIEATVRAIESYDHHAQREFLAAHDHFRLVGQDNIRRYRPVQALRVRLGVEDTFFEVFARVCAARAVGCRITVSLPAGYRAAAVDALETLTEPWAGAIEFVEETDEALAGAIRGGQTDRVRYAGPDRVPVDILSAAHEIPIFIARTPVLAEGRIELLWYVREQSLSANYHRYGNLGARYNEERAPVK